MAHALATPRRVRRNRPHWRKTASGRRHYNYFRDYDSRTGRYLQPDPIGLAGGISMYGYVGGHPLSAVDPFGLSEKDVERLRGVFNSTVEQMTADGRRLENPVRNNWNRFWGDDKLQDCGEQTETMIDAFKAFRDQKPPGGFDDKWHFQMQASNDHTHAWGRAWSENPNDPMIWFDTRANNFSVGSRCSTCSGWFTNGHTNPNPPPSEKGK